MSDVAAGPDLARWWESFYDDAAMLVLSDQDTDQIRKQVDCMLEILDLSVGAKVMDQCCGLGQHAKELAKRGYHTIGIDQSELYITKAKSETDHDSHGSLEFLVADATKFNLSAPCNAIINWHSSFGYLATDEDNSQMLHRALESLSDGGQMLLEYPNMFHLLRHFQDEISCDLRGGVELVRRCRLKPSDGTVRQTWTYTWPDGRSRSHESCLRIYLPDQLVSMFCESGFTDIRLLAGDGSSLTCEDARCIVTGRRK